MVVILMHTKSIELPVGIITGRNGIYLDEVISSYSPHILTFSGEINGKLCSKNKKNLRWIPYKIGFINVISYECQNIDVCTWEKLTQSSFDEVSEKCFVNGTAYGDDYRCFYFSTYDYMFKIVAKHYKVDLALPPLSRPSPVSL